MTSERTRLASSPFDWTAHRPPAPAATYDTRDDVDRDFDPPTIDADGESITLSRSERGRIPREGDRPVRERAFQAVRDEQD